jgi:hypothetical protein
MVQQGRLMSSYGENLINAIGYKQTYPKPCVDMGAVGNIVLSR